MSIQSNYSNEQQIRKVVEDWAQAIRDINMEGILAFHPEDVLMFDVAPPLQSQGKEAYKKTWDLFFQYSKGGKGSFELVNLHITASDTVAFCHALLIIDGNQWLIVHEHHSAPSSV